MKKPLLERIDRHLGRKRVLNEQSASTEAFAIVGESEGGTVYWKKWTGDSVAGRPEWTNQFGLNVLYPSRRTAERGQQSRHYHDDGIDNVRIVPVSISV